MDYTILKIESSNANYNGKWFKKNVEEDMSSIGMDLTGNEWIEYILSRVFADASEEDNRAIDAISKNDAITSATVELDDGWSIVKITKK